MRLIDADALRKKAQWMEMPDNQGINFDVHAVSVSSIDLAPTVDAVPVVRCKDCRNGRPIDKTKSPEKYFRDYCVVCEHEKVVGDEPMVYVPMHFCSYGERKDGEG